MARFYAHIKWPKLTPIEGKSTASQCRRHSCGLPTRQLPVQLTVSLAVCQSVCASERERVESERERELQLATFQSMCWQTICAVYEIILKCNKFYSNFVAQQKRRHKYSEASRGGERLCHKSVWPLIYIFSSIGCSTLLVVHSLLYFLYSYNIISLYTDFSQQSSLYPAQVFSISILNSALGNAHNFKLCSLKLVCN